MFSLRKSRTLGIENVEKTRAENNPAYPSYKFLNISNMAAISSNKHGNDTLEFLIWVLDINPVGPGKKKPKTINWSFNDQLMASITN